MNQQYLVSGTSTGLGRYLSRRLTSKKYNRRTNQVFDCHSAPEREFDTIFHAAFGQPGRSESAEQFLAHQLQIAKNIVQFKHERFVFISSVEVYRDTKELTSYGHAKIQVENLIMAEANRPTILRVGALLGPGMRQSQLIKTAIGDRTQLSLSPDSTFSLVLYDEVCDLGLNAAEGIHNLIPKPYISLSNIAKYFGTSPNWGTCTYRTPDVDDSEVGAIQTSEYEDSTIRKLADFISRRGWEYVEDENHVHKN
jgi:hypothetical protein